MASVVMPRACCPEEVLSTGARSRGRGSRAGVSCDPPWGVERGRGTPRSQWRFAVAIVAILTPFVYKAGRRAVGARAGGRHMPVVSWKRDAAVAILSMDNGENRHNPTFVAEFLAAMDAIEADPGARSVVIASSDPKCWSLGIDLDWVMTAATDAARHDEVRAFLRGLNTVFTRVLAYPAPVVAAIAGHCYGDGAILACACDFRFMRADRGFFCFPEVDVNIPFMPGMLAIVEKVFPMHLLESAYYSGRRLGGRELETHHVVTKAPDGAEETLAEAVKFAASFEKGRAIFGEMKRRKHARILETFVARDEPIIERLALLAGA